MISWIERRMQAWLATVREVHKIIFALCEDNFLILKLSLVFLNI